ncbi:MAG: CPBP family intramembrane glutamic endopeptidase [Planctomycetota bacterium]|nr:CPBP family intramembrane glutamic endopeptidase [Planctomycetota bacterium]
MSSSENLDESTPTKVASVEGIGSSPLLDNLAPVRPRVETALLAGLLAVLGMLAISLLLPLLVKSAQHSSESIQESLPVAEDLKTLAERSPGMLVLFSLLPQLMLTGLALGGSWLSPAGWQQRLGLTTGTMPKRYWILFALSTPVISVVTGLMISRLTSDLSQRMQELGGLYGGHTGLFGLLVLLLPTLVPGLCEELLFRGYVQTRLLQAWQPAKSILVSSLLFSAAHLSPIHALGVFPLSLWLGTIAMRCGCIWPAIFGHTVNNLFALVVLLARPHISTNPQISMVLGLFFVVSTCACITSFFFVSSQSAATRSYES